MTFDALLPEGRKGRVDEAMFRAAMEAAKTFAAEPTDWLVFEGTTGSGKTHLAAAIVNEIIENGSPAKYISALDIADLLRNERLDDAEDNEGGTFVSLLDAPMLVIDDLGAQQTANWIDSKIDQLLTHRFNGRQPTVIVLAKSIAEMPERIALKLDDPGLSRVAKLTGDGASEEERRVNLPKDVLESMTFESFNPDGAISATANDRASINIAFAAAKEFAHLKSPKEWLYLHGATGVGKTHLAVAIANELHKSGFEVTFWAVSDLLDRLRRTYSSRDETDFYEVFESVRNAKILILDEFGLQNATDWVLEKLYQLVRYRHDRRMSTVITSQFILWPGADNSEWRSVQDRLHWESILSRIRDSSVVTECLMAAPDYRNRGGGADPDN